MIHKRLSRLEQVLARPAEQPPVDMTPVMAQLDFHNVGIDTTADPPRLHKGRNSLERFASALGVSVARLWRLVATPGRKKFAALCGRLQRPFRTSVDDVAVEVVQAFIRDELRHRMRAIGVPITAPLCRVRPLEAV